MDVDALRTAIVGLTFGKRLPTAIYVWDQTGEQLPPILRTVCAELRRRLNIGPEANLLKFHTDQPKISFLSYPRFFEDPHPALATSVVVNLATGQVRHDSYASRANPPILHRKETFLPPDHPARERFAALTKTEEEAGLLTETSRIGFRLNWDQLIARRGFSFKGHRLVTTPSDASGVSSTSSVATLPVRIDRHRTALVRAEISKPTKTLLEYHQLRSGESFFDYGCGLGADVRALGAMGHVASGWDPIHAPGDPRSPADVVNLGFVLNVIEDPAERVEVLSSAWALARRLLVVATLIRGQEAYTDFQCFGDGVLTSGCPMAKPAQLPHSRPPLARMMRIHEEFQDARLTNCTKLAELLEVSTKTIARDLDFMRDQLGLPVEYDAQIYAWRYAHPVKNFPTVQVSEGELLALLVAQKALDQYRGTPFHDQLAHAFEKLSAGLRDQVSFSPAGSLANVSFHQFGPSKADLQIFERLSHAVLKSREIEFTYLKPRSTTAETRRMQPYHLANRENAWYLVGHDVERDALRTFAVSRIQKVTVGSKRFTKPSDFSPETYYAKSFGAFVGTGDHRVVVRFTPTAAAQIRERFWHETQEARELADGRLELRLHLNSLDEIQRWIMGWADQAEVVGPAELRQRVKAAAVAVTKLY